jgi:hypothetical protein
MALELFFPGTRTTPVLCTDSRSYQRVRMPTFLSRLGSPSRIHGPDVRICKPVHHCKPVLTYGFQYQAIVPVNVQRLLSGSSAVQLYFSLGLLHCPWGTSPQAPSKLLIHSLRLHPSSTPPLSPSCFALYLIAVPIYRAAGSHSQRILHVIVVVHVAYMILPP